MIVVSQYTGVKRGDLKYLFFLLTDKYYEPANVALAPLLETFSRDLGEFGALVKPFTADIEATQVDMRAKGWHEEEMHEIIPAILIMDVDFSEFHRKKNKHIIIASVNLLFPVKSNAMKLDQNSLT